MLRLWGGALAKSPGKPTYLAFSSWIAQSASNAILLTMRRSKGLVHAALALAAVCCSARISAGQTADNVLLVVNESSETSLQVGDAYARKRAIAPDHVVRLKISSAETISRAEFSEAIANPIALWLTK